jgi:hypothetical protein
MERRPSGTTLKGEVQTKESQNFKKVEQTQEEEV